MARRTLEDIMASQPQVDHAKLDATTDEEIRRNMVEDGEDAEAARGRMSKSGRRPGSASGSA